MDNVEGNCQQASTPRDVECFFPFILRAVSRARRLLLAKPDYFSMKHYVSTEVLLALPCIYHTLSTLSEASSAIDVNGNCEQEAT